MSSPNPHAMSLCAAWAVRMYQPKGDLEKMRQNLKLMHTSWHLQARNHARCSVHQAATSVLFDETFNISQHILSTDVSLVSFHFRLLPFPMCSCY